MKILVTAAMLAAIGFPSIPEADLPREVDTDDMGTFHFSPIREGLHHWVSGMEDGMLAFFRTGNLEGLPSEDPHIPSELADGGLSAEHLIDEDFAYRAFRRHVCDKARDFIAAVNEDDARRDKAAGIERENTYYLSRENYIPQRLGKDVVGYQVLLSKDELEFINSLRTRLVLPMPFPGSPLDMTPEIEEAVDKNELRTLAKLAALQVQARVDRYTEQRRQFYTAVREFIENRRTWDRVNAPPEDYIQTCAEGMDEIIAGVQFAQSEASE